MDDTKKNALAKLAERLSSNEVRVVVGDKFPIHLSKNAILDFRKARRIIAALAKFTETNYIEASKSQMFDILTTCRKIAEEGLEDVK